MRVLRPPPPQVRIRVRVRRGGELFSVPTRHLSAFVRILDSYVCVLQRCQDKDIRSRHHFEEVRFEHALIFDVNNTMFVN